MKGDMTKGNPMSLIIKFFIPMFIGNLFQQLYNVVDSVVVGRFVGNEAFAAVGSCFLIMSFISSILIGLSIGVGTLFSQLFGAKEYDQLKKTISTSFIFIMAISLILSIFTVIFLDEILILFKLPVEILPYAKDYLLYIFIGLFFTGLYNICAYLLRSIGDSKSPLYFLMISSVINIVLDLLFVIKFNMATMGVGLATLIAQAVAGIFALVYTVKKMEFLEFRRKDLVFDRSCFKEVLNYSVLTAIQQSISSFGMMLVQGLVNTFGTMTIAAFAACSKVDEFANRPLQDLSNAFSTYTAQNKGAKDDERIKEGFKDVVKLIGIISIIITSLAFIFAPDLIAIFVKRESVEIIDIGVRYLRFVSIFYVLLGFIVMFYGFFRGLGEIKLSVILTIMSQAVRVLLAYGLASVGFGFSSIGIAVVVGWSISDVLGVFLYKKVMNKNEELLGEKAK
ncbi:MAG: MATE family efflux transporter [Peptostreptococcus sp.]|uniref:MATE family efflux transporter n=1 Tax=Peptostreptococcus sp. TaxID=1262 RepID=UPI002FC92B4D